MMTMMMSINTSCNFHLFSGFKDGGLNVFGILLLLDLVFFFDVWKLRQLSTLSFRPSYRDKEETAIINLTSKIEPQD